MIAAVRKRFWGWSTRRKLRRMAVAAGVEMGKTFDLSEPEVRTGIDFIRHNVNRLLDTAELVVKGEGLLPHALAFYTVAVEEYGKAWLLKNCLPPANADGMISIRESDLIYHKPKFREALHHLPEEYAEFAVGVLVTLNSQWTARTVIYDENGTRLTFSIPPNTTGRVTDATLGDLKAVDMQMRMETLYVDWDDIDRSWRTLWERDADFRAEKSVAPEKLLQAIHALRQLVCDI